MKKGFADPPRRFEAEAAPKHNSRPGRGPTPGSKRAVNVSIDAEILKVAKEMKINLSQAFEETLRDLTKEERVHRFQEEGRDAIESYNRFIVEHGVWSKKYRKW